LGRAGHEQTVRPGVEEARTQPITERQSDEQVAFERLYRKHFEAVYAYVMRRAASADRADLISDVFATAWTRIADVPGAPEDKLWLFGVARRVVSQHSRGKSRRERLDVKLRRSVVPVAAAGPRDTSDLEERALSLIDALKPKDRELVTLIVWDGMTHAEVATILGCSTNAVGIRWHRALKRLRRDISGATDHQTKQSTLTLGQPLTEET
jgi:RNA polymerase sigma factor (sigma-70 family)